MPQFKIKDLMVNLGPTEVQIGPNWCQRVHTTCVFQPHHNSICWHFRTCINVFSVVGCPTPSLIACQTPSHITVLDSVRCPDPTPWTTLVVDPDVLDPGELTTLKAQLQAKLADIETHERAAAESLRPKTLAEVNQLEEQLQGALDELREMKQKMGGK